MSRTTNPKPPGVPVAFDPGAGPPESQPDAELQPEPAPEHLPEAPLPPAEPAPPRADGQRRFPCAQCGARVEFAPGTDHVRCPYCSAENDIPLATAGLVELDLFEYLRKMEAAAPKEPVPVVQCGACAAQVNVPDHVTSFSCPFCGSNIVADERQCEVIPPGAILPFKITKHEAEARFRAWIKKLWWAPGKLRERAMLDVALAGIYLPHWNFDATAITRYSGQRGDAYYVRVRTGNTTTMQRRIRWRPVSGRVVNDFVDLVVPASTSLPAKMVDNLTPWDTRELRVYQPDFLAGFRAETYTIPLKQGFATAQARMAVVIDSTIRADIGGDEQRITRKETTYRDVTFQHALLPVWVSAYRYSGKVFHFLVNARTGEVQGQRPYSAAKITLAVLAAVAAILVILWVVARSN